MVLARAGRDASRTQEYASTPMRSRNVFDIRRRTWLVYVLAGGLAMGAFAAAPMASLSQDAVYDGVALSSSIVILLGVRLNRPSNPWPWLLMAVGLFTFFLGDLLWLIYKQLGEDPFPSLADAFYLAGYPVLAAGLVIGIRSRMSGGDRSGLLDASILATSAAVLAWTFQIGPLVSGLDPEPLGFAISLAYPVADLVLIGVAIGLLTTPGARTTSFRLVAVSMVALLVADQVYALQVAGDTYVEGGLLDLGWLLSYVTWGAAALHPSMRVVFEPRPVAIALLGPVRIVFLGGAMLTGPALLAFAQPVPDPGLAVIAAGTAILSVLVLVRLSGLVRLLSADIAQRRMLEAKLSFQAFHDPLTQLPNRRLFVQRVEEALRRSHHAGDLAVLLLDLDDFKTVNDSMGHAAGDKLLEAVAGRIRASLRETDLAARLGGDEFAVLLPGIEDTADAEGVARRMAEALSAPLTVDGTVVPVAASIGIALLDEQTRTVDDLLRSADVAMYAAKARGKDRYQVYSPAIDFATETATPLPMHSRLPTREPSPQDPPPVPSLRPERA